MDIYDARLFAPALKRSDYTANPFALEVQYLRGFDGSAIAERSLKEMRRVGSISPEKKKLAGRHAPGLPRRQIRRPHHRNSQARRGHAVFVNGLARASIDDPEFSRYFFGIWLNPHTSEPKMRTELLAGASD